MSIKINLFIDKYARVGRSSIEKIIRRHGLVLSSRDYDFTLIIGGDGALIGNALKYISEPVVHIKKPTGHVAGSAGALSQYSVKSIGDVVDRLASGDFSIKHEIVLSARYMGKTYKTVGDFYIERGDTRQALRYTYIISDKGSLVKGSAISNGLIVTTPLGSTGYYSYIDRLEGRQPKRINGIGVAHILPININDNGTGRIRREFSTSAKVRVIFLRNRKQYLYGVPGRDSGIKVLPGKKVEFEVSNEVLNRVVFA